MPFPTHVLDTTPATVRTAFQKQPILLAESGNLGNVNVTSILTHVIQVTGRFAERYASDVLYSLDDIRALVDGNFEGGLVLDKPIDEILVMGIRRDGVDHASFLLSRLLGTKRGGLDPYVYPEHVYRAILAVRVQIVNDAPGPAKVVCTLKDITNAIIKVDPADLDADGKPLPIPYENGNPVPTKGGA